MNPRSGGNGKPARLEELLRRLQQVVQKTVLTGHPGHAAELAAEAHGYGGIAVVGGDGTLFEILKRVNLEQQRIALIPTGRGNSLAHDLGLVHRRAFLDVIHWGEAISIDLLEVKMTTAKGSGSRHLAASTVAVGYATAVTRRAREIAWMRRMSYAGAAAATRPFHFAARVQYDDGVPRDVRLSGFIASNTRYLANFLAFHKASYADGLFEVMEMDAGYLKQTAHNLSALSGTGIYEPYSPMETRRARVSLTTPQDVMMDGEIFRDVLSLDIRILPSALSCNGRGPK